MFERIVINRQAFTGEPIDLGFLAECLVFYRKVRVISDAETFRFLVRVCGPDELLDLLTRGDLELEFFDNSTGVQTVDTNIGPLHELIAYTADVIRYPQVARKLFDELSGPSGKGAAKLYNKYQRVTRRSTYTKEMLVQSRRDWLDAGYTSSATKSLLSLFAPEYVAREPMVFRVTEIPDAAHTGGKFKVTTNIDFVAANNSYHQHVSPKHSSLSPAYLLGHIADTRRDLIVGAQSQSEFAVAPARAVIAVCKFAELLAAGNRGVEILDIFQETAVQGLPRIREVVNSGDRTFVDVVRLLRQGERFKDWIEKSGPDADLRSEYCREIARIGWADKLPRKTLRWLLVNASTTVLSSVAGHPIAGAVAANAVSALDFFLIDRIIKGWRPNQFIDGPLKQFVNTSTSAVANSANAGHAKAS